MSGFPRNLTIALSLRAAILLVLSGGLLGVAGSAADVVATIAATVILASLILSGAVLVWLADLARRKGASGAGWLTAQGAVVLLSSIVAPVLLIDDPLIHSAIVLWIFAGAHGLAGVLEIAAGVSKLAGGISVAVASALVLVILVRPTTELLDFLGQAGLVIGLGGIGLAWAAVRRAIS